jgi:ABC-type antimicrobial peptide transport system permease subunit
MISVPAGIVANQEATQNLSANYDKTVSQMEQQLTLIMCTNSSSSTSSFPGGSFPGGGYGRIFAGFGGQTNYMNESYVVDAIRSIPGVEAMAPILEVPEGITTQTLPGYGGRTFTFNTSSYTVVGVPLNSSLIDNYSILPTNITAGRNLLDGDTGVVVLSLNNTEYFGVGVGDKVNILGTNFEVVGVHGESGSSSYVMGRASNINNLYMNITDAQAVTNHTGEISGLDVYAKNSSATLVSTVASDISSMFPELSVTTDQSQLQQVENTYNSTVASNESAISQTQTVAFQEIIVSVLATCLIVLFVMLYTVRERTKEIGTLKAIGFSNWTVMSQFMLEGVLLSLAAGIVGIGIGSVAAPTLSGLLLPHMTSFIGSTFGSSGRSFGAGGGRFVVAGGTSGVGGATAVLSPELMLLALGGAIVLGALGSLYPAWRASRTRPAEAMRYE